MSFHAIPLNCSTNALRTAILESKDAWSKSLSLSLSSSSSLLSDWFSITTPLIPLLDHASSDGGGGGNK